MDFESFLTYPRWEILKIIAEKPTSPVEISEILGTTVSYASQQLKLLDAAGLIIKEKTGASLKGKPRTLFRLSNELFYVSVLTKGFSEKRLIYLDSYHRVIVKIWLIEDETLHYPLMKLFWNVEENLKDINGIFFDIKKEKIIIVTDSKKVKINAEKCIKNFDKKLSLSFATENNFNKIPLENLFSLYEKDDSLRELKGGQS